MSRHTARDTGLPPGNVGEGKGGGWCRSGPHGYTSLVKRDHMNGKVHSCQEWSFGFPCHLTFPLTLGKYSSSSVKCQVWWFQMSQMTAKATLHLKFHYENVSSSLGKSLCVWDFFFCRLLHPQYWTAERNLSLWKCILTDTGHERLLNFTE